MCEVTSRCAETSCASKDGEGWRGVENIGGNSESTKEYEYTDAGSLVDNRVLYYRLKVEDNDGTYKNLQGGLLW